jgi:hypothetical protein
VHIPAKNSRVVPMLIMPLVRKAMDLLNEIRIKQDLSSGNKFFFASDSANGHLQQFKVLKRVAAEANLDQPHLVRSTKLRKYLATMAQVSVCVLNSNFSVRASAYHAMYCTFTV